MYENQQRYMAIAIANKLHIAETGTPSVQIKFGLMYNMSNPNVSYNRIIWASLYLSDNCFEKTMDTLTNIFGFSSENIQDINDNPSLFEGINAILVTDFETYNGKKYEKVKFINHPNGGAGKPLDDIAAGQLNNDLRNKLKAYYMKNKTGNKSAPQPQRSTLPPVRNAGMPEQGQAQTNDPNDEDLPF